MPNNSEDIIRLAEEVAKAGTRLLQLREVTDGCGEDYLKAVREYVRLFQSATEGQD